MLVYISTYPPRECGIATFTKDLSLSMGSLLDSKIIAMNDRKHNYDKNVIAKISAEKIEDYTKVASIINKNDQVEMVHIQHEFGIFGGEYGEYLITLLNDLKKPVITTFHTVLPDPSLKMKNIVREIIEKSKAIIVMNRHSRDILEKDYGAPSEKVLFIPHGIPNFPLSSGKEEKEKLNLSENIVLSTYGLISEGKGIEYFIQAIASVVKFFPNVKYLILGETHPVVKKREGEKYRNFLKSEVKRLNLSKNVIFYNKYLNSEDIRFFLNATDIYLSPMLDEKQSVSGTISFALGCGKPVISTSTFYAKSVVTEKRGILVGFKDPERISKAILEIINNPSKMKEMGINAYTDSRFMTWPNVALAHYDLYRKYVNFPDIKKIPDIKLNHLNNLTDNFGIIQFAKNTLPDLTYGYSTDDNARALIVAINHYLKEGNKKCLKIIKTYLNFIKIVQKKDGSFFNYVDKEKNIETGKISEDVQGRVVWSLGYLISQKNIPQQIIKEAEGIFNKSLPYIKNLKSLRAKAFSIMGLNSNKDLLRKFADSLLASFKKENQKKWNWFEDCLTYSSSKIPEALFVAYSTLKDEKYLKVAEKSLAFLMKKTFTKKEYLPIGQNGWYFKNKRRSLFDQQPEDPSSMVQALVSAYEITKKEEYKEKAIIAFEWFLGRNYLRQVMYDDFTGGCYDGLGKYSININQGAESTVCYLLARQSIEKVLS